MSAFDDWVDDLNESTPNRQSFSTGPVMVWMRMSFDAGLEAAAVECEGLDNRTMASLIRALKD